MVSWFCLFTKTEVQYLYYLWSQRINNLNESSLHARQPEKLQLWAAESAGGEAEPSFSFLLGAACLPPAGDEGGSFRESSKKSSERSRSTLWTRTESRTFFSSDPKQPRTWRSTEVFPAGRPIPTRSLGITCWSKWVSTTLRVFKHILVYLPLLSLLKSFRCSSEYIISLWSRSKINLLQCCHSHQSGDSRYRSGLRYDLCKQ